MNHPRALQDASASASAFRPPSSGAANKIDRIGSAFERPGRAKNSPTALSNSPHKRRTPMPTKLAILLMASAAFVGPAQAFELASKDVASGGTLKMDQVANVFGCKG